MESKQLYFFLIFLSYDFVSVDAYAPVNTFSLSIWSVPQLIYKYPNDECYVIWLIVRENKEEVHACGGCRLQLGKLFLILIPVI